MNEITYDFGNLEHSNAKWEKSPTLRAYYHSIYRFIASCVEFSGSALELGSGIGKIKDVMPNVTTSDIQQTRFVDRVVSAYDIEATAQKWDTIILTDVLHHLRYPFDFLKSASASLTEQGKIIICDPAATYWGRFMYGLFHHEPITLNHVQPPFRFDADAASELFANGAMAYGMFCKHQEKTGGMLEALSLEVTEIHFRDYVAYFTTGGFSKPSLISPSRLSLLLKWESILPQWLGRRFALRMFVILRKKLA